MSPYKKDPRRPFAHQMMCPYFQTQHYKENHTSKTEEAIERIFKKIFKRNKK